VQMLANFFGDPVLKRIVFCGSFCHLYLDPLP
jgi:hypothetical protein